MSWWPPTLLTPTESNNENSKTPQIKEKKTSDEDSKDSAFENELLIQKQKLLQKVL